MSLILLRILSVQSFRLPPSPRCRWKRNIFHRTYTSADVIHSSANNRHSDGLVRRERNDIHRNDNGTNEEKGEEFDDNDDDSNLSWETFEFGTTPKMDKRFDNLPTKNDNNNKVGDNDDLWHIQCDTKQLETIASQETEKDQALQQKLHQYHSLWDELPLDTISQATELLRPQLSPERWNRIHSVVSKRTQQTRFLFENPSNPSNVWACLRTLDSFGIQYVDVVLQSDQYHGKGALSQKRGMRTAMGSAKWLTLNHHLNTKQALQQQKENGHHIICTDVNPHSKDIRQVDWDASGKKLCIVMGNEYMGISDCVKKMADESFYLPMSGMAESFNLSVATAITLAHLSAASTSTSSTDEQDNPIAIATAATTKPPKGPLRPGDLSEREYKMLLLKGVINSMKPKMVQSLFRHYGLNIPSDLYR